LAQERERKYLVIDDSWRSAAGPGTQIRQGYLAITDRCTVRVRVRGDSGYLTVKGRRLIDVRAEYEYSVSREEAEQMLDQLCSSLIEKRRYEVHVAGVLFEIDEFYGDNAGLVLAERELHERDNLAIPLPPWAGADVTEDERYYNAHLSRYPFGTWNTADETGDRPGIG
jgi:adenylate cyclase